MFDPQKYKLFRKILLTLKKCSNKKKLKKSSEKKLKTKLFNKKNLFDQLIFKTPPPAWNFSHWNGWHTALDRGHEQCAHYILVFPSFVGNRCHLKALYHRHTYTVHTIDTQNWVLTCNRHGKHVQFWAAKSTVS